MFYTDESVLMDPSPVALQKRLHICYEYPCAFKCELKYTKKTSHRAVKPKWLQYLNNTAFTLASLHTPYDFRQFF